MVLLNILAIIVALLSIIFRISATTHWVVTENGRIQSQIDSMFHMRRPYDLLSLLEQEKTVRTIEDLRKELITRKISIDQKWETLEGAADLESRLYSQDRDCLNGHTLGDTDVGISLIGDIRERIDLDTYLVASQSGVPELPDCMAAIDLDFSMPSFEHLQVMAKRANLTANPELSLASFILEDQDMAQFAHQVAFGLQRNATSWLHHNLAAVYWRIRGDAPSAIECARRAVHFAPRQYKDLALLTLGGLLQQAKALVEAALVLHAAVDHEPLASQNHLALGRVYAILGDYNRSIACLDNVLKLQPSLVSALKLKHTVKCHYKLEQGLLDLHQSLQGMLGELQEYNVCQERLLQLQDRLRRERAPLDLHSLDEDSALVSFILGPKCAQELSEGSPSSHICHYSGLSNFPWEAQTLQMLLRKVETRAKKISEQMLRRNPLTLEQSFREMVDERAGDSDEDELFLTAKSDSVVTNNHGGKQEADSSPDVWPSQEECTTYANQFPAMKDVSSVFFAPEDKGFEAQIYLSRLIGLDSDEEHALPWYPPTCTANDGAQDPSVQKLFPNFPPQNSNSEYVPETQLLPYLLKYGIQGQPVEAEIGQRILSAINKDVGPRWLLHSLAALYWRVKGNVAQTMDCLRVAVASAPSRLRDLPLISLGSVLLRSGHLQAAKQAAWEALAVDDKQVVSQFLLGLILESQGNHSGSIHHLKKVVDDQPTYLNGQAYDLLRAIACQEKYSSYSKTEDRPPEGDMCGTGKPRDLLSSLESMREGDTVVCSVDGQECHTMQCFSPSQDSGGLMTLDAASMSQLLGSGGRQCSSENLLEHPDETELERMGDNTPLSKHFRLRIALGEEEMQSPNLGEFYVPVALMDNAWLKVYDKSGTYALSPAECERIHNIDWIQETALWLSSSNANMLKVEELPPVDGKKHLENREPECDDSLPPSQLTLDHLAGVRLRHRAHTSAELGLQLWLGTILGDPTSSLSQLAARLAAALKENTTSWVVATAAALYWQVVGRADQAITCLRHALQYVPTTERKVPLVNLASILSRAGFYSDALVAANMAMELAPKFFMVHFTAANIHASMGDMEKAITYYRSSLELEPKFEPARNRLLAILCTILFEERIKPNE